LFRQDELLFSGAKNPLVALVLCGTHQADRVMIGGRWVVGNGAIPGLEPRELLRRHGGRGAVADELIPVQRYFQPAVARRRTAGNLLQCIRNIVSPSPGFPAGAVITPLQPSTTTGLSPFA
jgi:hypothetical protein